MGKVDMSYQSQNIIEVQIPAPFLISNLLKNFGFGDKIELGSNFCKPSGPLPGPPTKIGPIYANPNTVLATGRLDLYCLKQAQMKI